MYRRNIAEQFGWYSKKFEYSQDYDLTLKLLENDLFLIREYLQLHYVSFTKYDKYKTFKHSFSKRNR